MILQTETPEFDSIALGAVSHCKLDVAEPRQLFGVDVQVTGANGDGAASVSDVIDTISVIANGQTKMVLKPGLSRALDDYLNANDDPIPSEFFRVPFSRPDVPGSEWGLGDIRTLMLECQIKAAFANGVTLTRLQAVQTYRPLPAHVNRGSVFLQGVFTRTNVIAGWNVIDDLPVSLITHVSRMLFQAANIDEVEMFIGSARIYHMTRNQAYNAVSRNPNYKIPSNDSEANLDTFPAFLDVVGRPEDYPSLLQGNVRLPLKVRYHITANPATFDLLVEGVERVSDTAALKAA